MAPLDALAFAVEPDLGTKAEAASLNARYGDRDAKSVIAVAAEELFRDRIECRIDGEAALLGGDLG